MTIYLICKHRRFRDRYGSGIYKDFTIYKYFFTNSIAKLKVKDLNKRSIKYFYRIKKIET